MKKIYAILLVLAVLIAIGAYWLFSNAFSWANYTNELADQLSKALQANALTVEYNGEIHQIDSGSVDALLRILRRGASEVKDVKAPPETYDGKIIIHMDQTIINVYRPTKDVDEVVMERVVNGRSNCTSLKGYETFKWLLQATGFAEDA